MSLNTFISVLADARVRVGLLQPHVDVVDVRHRQVEQRGRGRGIGGRGGGSGSATWRDYACEDGGDGEDERPRPRPINGRKSKPH